MAAQNIEQRAYSLEQTVKVLNLSEHPVRQALRTGRLHGVKFGRRWLISRDSIDQFLAGEQDRGAHDR